MPSGESGSLVVTSIVVAYPTTADVAEAAPATVVMGESMLIVASVYLALRVICRKWHDSELQRLLTPVFVLGF